MRIRDGKKSDPQHWKQDESYIISMIWLFFTISPNVGDDGITELPYMSL
jgi:hypothetical protein